MNEDSLRVMLERVATGHESVNDAIAALRTLPFEDLGFAKLDHHRTLRWGFPEVVFCPGKTATQVADIVARLVLRSPRGSCDQWDFTSMLLSVPHLFVNSVP